MNPSFNDPKRQLLKTSLVKEKTLITSIFFFSNNICFNLSKSSHFVSNIEFINHIKLFSGNAFYLYESRLTDRGSVFHFKSKTINYSPLNPMLWVLIRIVSSRQF